MYGFTVFTLTVLVWLPQSCMIVFGSLGLGISVMLYCFVDRLGGDSLSTRMPDMLFFKNVYWHYSLNSFALGISSRGYLKDN